MKSEENDEKRRYNKPGRAGEPQCSSETDLLNAILEAACEDYIAGLKNIDTWRGRGVYEGAKRFILSRRFSRLCSLNPHELLKRLDEKAEQMTTKPEIKTRAEWWGVPVPKNVDELDLLTRREDEVWELAEDGYTKTEMAEKMGVSRSAMDRFIASRGMRTNAVSTHAAEQTKIPKKKRAGNE